MESSYEHWRSAERYEFYSSLAPWWPLISPVEDYAEEAAYFRELLIEMVGPSGSVLELGSGGGHLASHLAGDFALTLADLSTDMLAVSQRLNPDCVHVRGDMRSLRIDQRFDAVLIHDAIDYMLDESDLAAVFDTVRHHLRPGGCLLAIPDDTKETFEPGTCTTVGEDPDGHSVRLDERSWDPDPSDTWTRTDYTFTLGHPDGSSTTVSEAHRHGLFPEATWIRLLAEAGLEPTSLVERTDEARPARSVFVGRSPLDRNPP